MFANEEKETMGREEIKALQLSRLKKQIKWACSKSSFYQKKFTEAGIGVPQIDSLDDLEKLPCTTMQDVAGASPFDLLTLPLSGILRVAKHGTANAFTKMYTQGDIAYQVEMMTRVLIAQGVNNASKVAILWDMSDSRVLDIHYALENIGAAVMILGSDMEKASSILKVCQPDVLISDFRQVTQLMVHIQAYMNTGGLMGTIIDYQSFGNELKVPLVLCLEETMHNPMRTYIERRMGARVVTIYNSPGLGCSGIMFPCVDGKGLHVNEDYFYPEILDFGTGKVIHEPAHVGELVFTTLVAEAMPIIRYRTGQTAMLLDEPCECGRGFVRVATPTEYFTAY